MKFNYIVNPNIPQAAWCASIETGKDSLTVELGNALPHNESFFVCGVWNGDFENGRFDLASFPCCTGARVLNDVNEGGGEILNSNTFA